MPFLKEVETFPESAVLFEHCEKFGFKGVVSKRLSSQYMSGPSRMWTKTKCPGWKRATEHRHKLFEGPSKAEESLREREPQKKARGVRHKYSSVSSGLEQITPRIG